MSEHDNRGGAVRPLSAPRLALAFSGVFLGAGYVSGQELWQFFGGFGPAGLAGLLLALVLQFILGCLILRLAALSRVTAIDAMVVERDRPRLRWGVGLAQLLFMFCVAVVMIAGAGALARQALGLPAWLGALAFSLLAAWVAYRGADSLINVFSVLVPALVLATLALCLWSLTQAELEDFSFVRVEKRNALLQLWPASALVLGSYNMFGALGLLTPLAARLPAGRAGLRRTRWGVGAGCGLLLLIAGGILVSVTLFPETAQTDLPLLALAARLGPGAGLAYALLLLCGMFGATITMSFSILNLSVQRWPGLGRRRLSLVAALLSLAWALSLFGFGDLIGTIYPLFGYFGALMLAGVISHYLHVRGKRL